ncbi:MAG: hypothetical protein CK428_30750 [Mycobacterium sp.]|nr:MAG: hypothetical protein CK428_30750 [Mycobacterium sp.]
MPEANFGNVDRAPVGQLSSDDLGVVEINEACAPVVLARPVELNADPQVNPNGGVVAPRPPVGCTGAQLMTSLAHKLQRTGGRYGLQTTRQGAGRVNATLIERL